MIWENYYRDLFDRIWDETYDSMHINGAGWPLAAYYDWRPDFLVKVNSLNYYRTGFPHEDALLDILTKDLDHFRPIRIGTFDNHNFIDQGMLIVMDVEHFTNQKDYLDNPDNVKYVFNNLEYFHQYRVDLLNRHGIKFLIDTTKSGDHILSRVKNNSSSYWALANLCYNLPQSLVNQYAMADSSDFAKRCKPVPKDLGLAYHGLANLMLYISLRTIKDMKGFSGDFPMAISDSYYHTGSLGGLSLDITQYADPVFMRVIRNILSTHNKELIRKHLCPTGYYLPTFDIIRPKGMDVDELLYKMYNMQEAKNHHLNMNTSIPEDNNGWAALADTFIHDSDLGFKDYLDYFYDESKIRYSPEETDRLAKESKMQWIDKFLLMDPVHSLMTPTCLQEFIEIMIDKKYGGVSFHPMEVSRLISSYYTNPNIKGFSYNPNSRWDKYNPDCRANFWVLAYSAMYELGLTSYTG